MSDLDIEEKEPAGLTYPRVTDAERARRREAALAKGPPACATCGKPTTFDETIVAMTVGGLWLKGWYVCKDQHGSLASGLCEVTDAPQWAIAKGGRSVDIGTGRIRFGAVKVESGERLDVVGLMTRIARLPELERGASDLLAALADASDDGAAWTSEMSERVAAAVDVVRSALGRATESNSPLRTSEETK